jgi:hypothetical protein
VFYCIQAFLAVFHLQYLVPCYQHLLTHAQAGTRFTEDELHDILAIIQQVFDEEEGNIPEGVEHMEMPKIANKLLGANKKRRKVKRKA